MKNIFNKKTKNSVALFLFGLFFIVPVNLYAADFEPSLYAPETDSIFVESAAYEDMLKNLKSFFLSLKKTGGEQELNAFGMNFKALLGINLLNIDELKKTGVDIKSPLGFTLRFAPIDENTNLQNEIIDEWVFYIPAKDSKTLYKYLLTTIKNMNEPPPGQNQTPDMQINTIKEIDEGESFEYESFSEKNYYVRADNFIGVTNSKERYKIIAEKNSKPVARADYYIQTKNFAENSNQKDEMLFIIALNPKQTEGMTDSFLKNIPGAAALPKQKNPLEKENLDNLLSTGSVIFSGEKGIGLIMQSRYKDGFLDDTANKTAALIKNSSPSLLVDSYSNSLMFYMALKFNFIELINLAKEIDPKVQTEINNLSKTISATGKYNVEKDLLPALNGRFSFVLGEIPPQKDLEEIAKWQGYFSFGVNPKEKKGIENLIAIIKEKNKKDKNFSITASSYKRGKLFTIKIITPPKKTSGQKKAAAKPKVDLIFLYLDNAEAIVTVSKKNIDLLLSKQKDTIISRLKLLDEKDEKNLIMTMFFNLESAVQYLNTTSLKMMIMGYLPYLSNLLDFSISAYRKESSFEEIIYLRLKR
ncbi:MAG: hypothetical protein OEZ13_09660 [Spirochaetia bacterium]|nr:hypothetical protein [Spirochaetia bacterium]